MHFANGWWHQQTKIRNSSPMKSIIAGSIVSLLATLGLAAVGRAQDVFDASPQVYVVHDHGSGDGNSGPAPSHKGPVVHLSQGEVKEVLESSKFAGPELAFYLPEEGTSVAQVVVERQGLKVNYYLKGLHRGRTVGGAVSRAWLDASGFYPRNDADEARIQEAVRNNPLYIEVQ
jgi:hypothetical protein